MDKQTPVFDAVKGEAISSEELKCVRANLGFPDNECCHDNLCECGYHCKCCLGCPCPKNKLKILNTPHSEELKKECQCPLGSNSICKKCGEMPEELKKEWEREFDDEFPYLGEDSYDLNRKGIKSFISSLLAKQQAENQKIIDGIFEIKEKELARQQEEFVKMIDELYKPLLNPNGMGCPCGRLSDECGCYEYDQALADIKSKLNK